ncbi:MAG: hypothetical protein F4W92_05635 [Gammaproteobacteria bacterium]|nr:hypothetical protein [Gammaproteobacteria bacterium]
MQSSFEAANDDNDVVSPLSAGTGSLTITVENHNSFMNHTSQSVQTTKISVNDILKLAGLPRI